MQQNPQQEDPQRGVARSATPRPFTGLVAYPPTPFDASGAVDTATLRELVTRPAEGGADAVAVLGTSGSGVYLDAGERRTVVQHAVRALRGTGVPLHAAVSALSTRDAVAAARDAVDAGADGVLVSPVGYVPLTDEEVVPHVAAVAAAAGVPVCFYNNPTTTRYDVTLPVLRELAASGAMAAVKDTATGPEPWRERLAGYRDAGLPCAVGLSRDVLLLGAGSAADAWHSGVAALLPTAYVRLRAAVVAGDGPGAERWAGFLRPVVEELARLRPITGLHALAAAVGVPAGAPREPLRPAPDEAVRRLRELVAAVPAR
ncbi:dihydrodipicolinate synthase family protein [Kineococcus auxinigenes]|uniref:dihydrodipicolinate synthase family protein n=1 Tax=unclassified Kineococcus TaxID=2621656 RepID=UPI003D7D499B